MSEDINISSETTAPVPTDTAPPPVQNEPVVQPTPVANDASNASTTEAPQVENQTGDATSAAPTNQGRTPKPIQPRIAELTREKHEAKREAAYWKAMHEAQTAKAPADQAPTAEQFSSTEDYVRALTQWHVDQKVSQVVDSRLQDASNRRLAANRQQTYQERIVDAISKLPDFNDVVSSADLPLSNHVGDAVLDSERGPELVYHFAKNPDLLKRLNNMTEQQANREIGKLEVTLSSPTNTQPAPKVSNAPPPPTPLGTQGRSTTPALNTMGMEDYIKLRASQKAAWSR